MNIKPSQEEMNKRIQELRKKMETMVKEQGYVIQGVMNGEDSFGYTFGRNDKGLPDFFINKFSNPLAELFKEAQVIVDSGDWMEEHVYESEVLVSAEIEAEPTKFKLRYIDPTDVLGQALGVFNRGHQLADIRIIEIIVTGENNVFSESSWTERS